MKKSYLLSTIAIAILSFSLANAETHKEPKYTTQNGFTFLTYHNENGLDVSLAANSGLNILEVNEGALNYTFKDMNKNGKLDIFEDWRKNIDERATDLANQLTKDEIAGLMLFSSHERFPEKGLTEEQKKYLTFDNLRNVLNAGKNNVKETVLWVNKMQSFVESLDGNYIPVNFSSDPRSQAGEADVYNAEGEDISRWPTHLGLAATFNPKRVEEFAAMISEEYRALGITTALGPQIEITTDPRWLRASGTFGESEKLASALTKAYVKGLQNTYKNHEDLGFGEATVNAMIKHFPGDGIGEGGRESHTNAGKYAVLTSDNFTNNVKPFISGINIDGKIPQTASMMVHYSVIIGSDGKAKFGEKVASAYNKKIIDILRVDNNYDGVLCTDWSVTKEVEEEKQAGRIPLGMAYGYEKESIAKRHLDILKAGIDMFGGNNDKQPILEAYDMWQREFEAGKLPISADERFKQTGKRIIKMIMQAGLFEKPYLDYNDSKAKAGSKDKRDLGVKTQLESIVMLKNKNNTIKANLNAKDLIVYIPANHSYKFKSVFSSEGYKQGNSMNVDIAKTYFKKVITDEIVLDAEGKFQEIKLASDLSDVDLVIAGMNSPDNGNNFSYAGFNQDTKTFYPLSLQYKEYIADNANVRKKSIAGDTLANGDIENRSYFGQKSHIGNPYHLEAILKTKENIVKIEKETGKKIPIIVALKAKNPTIVSEFEKEVDALLVGFDVSDSAYFEIIAGKSEPQGLLPMQFPANMETVEANAEDKAFDLIPYIDEAGNKYDFAFGLNYSGVIKDERVKAFK